MKSIKATYLISGTTISKTYEAPDNSFSTQIIPEGHGAGKITIPGKTLLYAHLEHVEIDDIPDPEPTP